MYVASVMLPLLCNLYFLFSKIAHKAATTALKWVHLCHLTALYRNRSGTYTP